MQVKDSAKELAHSNSKDQSASRIIKMWFDSYDELFSDFDPNPYSSRVISDDFLFQLKKVTRKTLKEEFWLNFLFPDKIRDPEKEATVLQRLHQYFKNQKKFLLQKKNKKIKEGILLSVIGMLLMIIASYISFLNPNNFYIHLILILSEPAGWFLLWTGLEKLFNSTGKIKRELYFYSKLSETKIMFDSY